MKQVAWIVLSVAACGSVRNTAAVDAPLSIPDVFLDVNNIGGHCAVTVNDGETSTSAEESLGDLISGDTISLTASATTGFNLGLWHHTRNDTGSGDPGTITDTGSAAESSTSVTLGDSPGCVWICCSSGPDDCPTIDPCR